jgi:glycosyltransferase involved in cell wall biosynthesis
MLDRSKGGRLLMFAPVVPSDCGNGLAIRAGFFLDTYSRCFDVDLVVIPLLGSTSSTEFARSRATRVEVVGIYHADSHYRLVTSVRETSERLNAFRRYGQPSLSAFVSPACRSFQDLLGCETYDVVHVFRLYLAALATPWIAKARGYTRLVIDCDENDAAAYRSIAAMHRTLQNYEAADWADAEAVAFAHFATRWLPKFDIAFAASRQEVKTLANIGVRAEVVPNVAPAPMAAPSRRVKRPPTVLFVGTLGYAPNADAIIWFVSHVWRQLQRALHDRLRLIIVGSNPPTRLARLASQRGIEVTGAVDDVTAYYRNADLAIVPLRAGGGTRIKIIEAAAYGLPVVATRFGAEGTTFQHGVDMLIANNATNFLRACLLLLRNPAVSKRLALRARSRAKRDYLASYWRGRVMDFVSSGREYAPSDNAKEEIR